MRLVLSGRAQVPVMTRPLVKTCTVPLPISCASAPILPTPPAYPPGSTTTFFGAPVAPDFTTNGPARVERFHVPDAASHVYVGANSWFANAMCTAVAGVPAVTGVAE